MDVNVLILLTASTEQASCEHVVPRRVSVVLVFFMYRIASGRNMNVVTWGLRDNKCSLAPFYVVLINKNLGFFSLEKVKSTK